MPARDAARLTRLRGDRRSAPATRWRRAWTPFAAALLAIAFSLTASGEGDERTTEPSWIAPLASRSLLLGGALAGERVVAVGERGHILLSDDRGASWRQVVAPTRVTLVAVDFPTPTDGWAVGHDAVILHSSDAGETWTRQYADPELESPLLDVWFADSRRGMAVGAYGLVLATDDGGQTWQPRTISDGDVHHNAIAATRDGRLYVAGERGSAFRSDDGGESWEAVALPDQGSLFGAVPLPDGELLLLGLQGRVYRSEEEGGDVWRKVVEPGDSSLMGGAATEAGGVVLGGINGVLLVSADAGRTFEATRRADRQAVSTAAALPGAGVLIFGAFGAADGSDLLSGPGTRSAPAVRP